MTVSVLTGLCADQKGAVLSLPFGETPLCYKVGGHIFAEIYPAAPAYLVQQEVCGPDTPCVTLKCELLRADWLRREYPNAVFPGYHVPKAQKPFRNTILLDGTLSDVLIRELVLHSWTEVVQKLPKRQREAYQRA